MHFKKVEKKMRLKTKFTRRYLNDMWIEGMNAEDLYPVLVLEDLDHIQFAGSILKESVIRDETVEALFNYISTKNDKRTLMTLKEVMEYVPVGAKQFKTLQKANKSKFKLYVDICNFSSTDFFLELKYFSQDAIPNDKLIEKSIELTSKLNKYTEGGFVTFNGNDEFGILFLNSRNGVNITTFKHEFLHYLNWIKGAFKSFTTADESFYKEEIAAIRKHMNPQFYQDHFDYMTASNEYESLLSNFLDLLKEVKNDYFKDMDGSEFARMICDIIEFRHSRHNLGETDTFDTYFKRLSEQVFFNNVKKNLSFVMVVFFELIDNKTTNIKNHIFGYFLRNEHY